MTVLSQILVLASEKMVAAQIAHPLAPSGASFQLAASEMACQLVNQPAKCPDGRSAANQQVKWPVSKSISQQVGPVLHRVLGSQIAHVQTMSRP